MLTKTKKSTLSIREGPGPERYYLNNLSTLPAKPSFSVTRERRATDKPLASGNLPGPGSYNTLLNQTAVQNILFGKARRSVADADLKDTPGPGTYNVRTYLEPEKHNKRKHSKVLKRLRNMFCKQLRHGSKKKGSL